MFASTIEVFGGLKTGGGLEFGESGVIAPQARQAGGEIVMVAGRRLEAKSLTEFSLRGSEVLAIEERDGQIVMS